MKDSMRVQTATPTVDLIVVTYNNADLLARCIRSLLANTGEPTRIVIVNNGDPINIQGPSSVVVLNTGSNLGWMGGVNHGVRWTAENNPAPFVLWMNDDTQILDHDHGWLTKMLNCFQLDPAVGAVGPTSNAVMGQQTMQLQGLPPAIEVTRLSGLCFLTRREHTMTVGLLDESLPGGDDLDYSIRMKDAGLKLCVCRRVFLFHHYAQTGRKVHGDYWDSQKHAEDLNTALIKKHGFKKWMDCISDRLGAGPAGYDFVASEESLALSELDPVIAAGGKVLDLGCGGRKLHEKMVGVDIRANDQMGVGGNMGITPAADVEADVICLPMAGRSVDGILAKHLLEHIVDPIAALEEWHRVLKPGGKLVVLCPDYRFCEAISVDPSHVHAYTPGSVQSLLKISGFDVKRVENVKPGYVFMVSALANHKTDVSYKDKDCAVVAI